MQSTSSGSHGSSDTIPPRADPAVVGVAPPPDESVGVGRALVGGDGPVDVRPGEPIAEPAVARIICVPIVVRAPMVGGDVDPPIEGMVCTRATVEVGVPVVGIAAVPTVG